MIRILAKLLLTSGLSIGAFALAHAFFFPRMNVRQDAVILDYFRERIQFATAQKGPGPRILVLGDSTAATGILAPLLPDATSIALLNGSSIETFHALRKYLDSGFKPRCAVVAWSHHWPAYNHFFWSTFVRNRFYSDDELGRIYETSRANGAFPAATYSPWEYRAVALAFRTGLMGIDPVLVQYALYPEGVAIRQEFAARIRKHLGSNPIERIQVPDVPRSAIPEGSASRLFGIYVDRLVALARERGIRLHLVEIPGAPESDLKAHARSAIASVPGNSVISDPRPYGGEYFGDARHLVTRGAERLTGFVREKLRCD